MSRVRLPLRVQVGVAAVGVLLLAAIGAVTAAVQIGAGALDAGGAYVQTIPSTDRPVWIGIDLENRGALPVTLTAFVPRGLEHLRVTGQRVVDLAGGEGFSALPEPLPADLQARLDASVPVDGFVLPAGSRNRYEIVVRMQRTEPLLQAALVGGAVTYRVFGLDQGVLMNGVTCIRAPGSAHCPPYAD